jgi:hypothetical protein
MKYEGEPREGMPITRMEGGKKVNLSGLKQDTLALIDMLAEMNNEFESCRASCNWEAMLKLAQMYEERNMLNMAARIRKECFEHGAKFTVGTHSPDPRRRHIKKAAGGNTNIARVADHRSNIAVSGGGAPLAGVGGRKKVPAGVDDHFQRARVPARSAKSGV